MKLQKEQTYGLYNGTSHNRKRSSDVQLQLIMKRDFLGGVELDYQSLQLLITVLGVPGCCPGTCFSGLLAKQPGELRRDFNEILRNG